MYITIFSFFKPIIHAPKNKYHLGTLLILLSLLLSPVLGKGQGETIEVFYLSVSSGDPVPVTLEVSGLPGTGCGNTAESHVCGYELSFCQALGEDDNFLQNTPTSKYQISRRGEAITLTLSFDTGSFELNDVDDVFYGVYYVTNATTDNSNTEELSTTLTVNEPTHKEVEVTFTPNVGSDNDYLAIGLISEFNPTFPLSTLMIPFLVEGAYNVESEGENSGVPILGTTSQPITPYMILHDPPGDASYATYKNDKEICRSYEQTTASAETNGGEVDHKRSLLGWCRLRWHPM